MSSEPRTTTLDLNKLTRLAKKAADGHALDALDWDAHGMGSGPNCAAYIAAVSPDVVLELIRLARLREVPA
jgi:hypothetical protein